MQRQDDPSFMTINREVPLWSIIVGLIMIVAQAAVAQYTLSQQGDVLRQMGTRLERIEVSFDLLRAKGMEHDYAIKDLERRVRDMEGKGK